MKTEQTPSSTPGRSDLLDQTASSFPVEMRIEFVAPSSHFDGESMTFEDAKDTVDEIARMEDPWNELHQWQLEDEHLDLKIGGAEFEKPENRDVDHDPEDGELCRLVLRAKGEINTKIYKEFFGLDEAPETIKLGDLKSDFENLAYDSFFELLDETGVYEPVKLGIDMTRA